MITEFEDYKISLMLYNLKRRITNLYIVNKYNIFYIFYFFAHKY